MRLPPESFPVVIAAAGALALGVGAVAALDGNLWGIPLALGGAVAALVVGPGDEEGLASGASNAPPWQPGRRSGRCGRARPRA